MNLTSTTLMNNDSKQLVITVIGNQDKLGHRGPQSLRENS